MIDTTLFPYENHPFRLEFGEKKNLSICWFNCEEYLQKHITRHNLKQKEITIHYRDEKPIKSSKKHKKSLQQTVEKDDHRSGGGHRRSTKNLDTDGTINSTRKPKK